MPTGTPKKPAPYHKSTPLAEVGEVYTFSPDQTTDEPDIDFIPPELDKDVAFSNLTKPEIEELGILYRGGRMTIPELATKYATSPDVILDLCRMYGYTRDLAEDIREQTNRNLAVVDAIQATHPATAEELVRAAARTSTQVVLNHRHDIARLRRLTNKIAERMEVYLDTGAPPTIDVDPDTGEILDTPIPLPLLGPKESPSDIIEKLSRTLVRTIQLERQSFGIDETKNTTDPLTATDFSVALKKLTDDQREQLRAVASAISGGSPPDAARIGPPRL